MKFIAFILVFFTSIYTFARTIEITVIEGYKSQPYPNCIVKALSNDGKVLQEGKTDAKGRFTFVKLKESNIIIKTFDDSRNYYNEELSFSGKKNQEYTFYIYPTPVFENKILNAEDVKFGKVKTSTSSSEYDVFESMGETEATFIGGKSKLMSFIGHSINYPMKAIELNEQGKVFISFVVEKDGSISHVIVEKSPSKILEREAVRVIRAMPNWIPGTIEGKAVRTRCRVPINFTLG